MLMLFIMELNFVSFVSLNFLNKISRKFKRINALIYFENENTNAETWKLPLQFVHTVDTRYYLYLIIF